MKSRSSQSSTQVLPEVVIDNVAAGIDWLTVTAKTQELRDALFAECNRIKTILAANGARVRTWQFKGYTGFSVAGLRWGTRADSDIGMLSGVDAHQNWYVLGEYADGCSRIDLAVTVQTDKCFPGLLDKYYEFLASPAANSVSFKRAIVKNSDGGQTLYIGSRASRAFGRVYDKGIEAGLEDQPGKLWRYEVEFKKPLAQSILKQVLANKYLPQGTRWDEEVAQSIASTVYVWYEARNVPPIFTRRDNGALSLEVEARVLSDDISLNWLTTQVRPTVLRLTQRGKLDQVKRALGLSDDIQSWLNSAA